MSHLSGRCTCGRIIHYPKGSTYGDSWTCRNCGKTWYISHEGDPLHNRRSKAPPENSYSGGGSGCMVPIVIGAIALFIAGCVLS